MSRIFKLLLFLIVAAFVSLVSYAYLGDMTPDQSEVRQPIILNVD